jgi:alkylhydroperoxidase family enzyme
MPHIALNSAEPGIRGLLRYRPETARPLSELTEVLLRGPSTLTRGERELIAAYVSALNDCQYCSSSHSACAAAQLPGAWRWWSRSAPTPLPRLPRGLPGDGYAEAG